MRVKHLINELKNYDPNAVINITVRTDNKLKEIITDNIIEVVEYEGQDDTWVVISGINGCYVY